MEGETKELPTTPQLPVQKSKSSKLILVAIICFVFGAGAFGAVTFLGYTNGFMTDGACNDMIINASEFAYTYGTELQLVYLMNESINCRQIPIKYDDYERTLIPIECLNLNNQEVNQNG